MTLASTIASPTTGRIDVGNNVGLYYEHYESKGSNPCVVLLHSLAMDHTFWRLVAPALAAHGPVVCVDVRGHGQSDKPAGPYSISLFANDVAQLVKALGYNQVVVAGASMGGCIALQFAIDHPSLACGLGLIDTTAWYGATAPADWSGRADKARENGLESLFDFQATRWFSEAFRAENADVLRDCMDVFVRNDVEAYAATCNALGNFDGRDGLASLALPTAVVVGEDDQATTPAMAEHLHQGIKGSTLTIIPAVRHLTPLEAPDTITTILLELAREAKRPSA